MPVDYNQMSHFEIIQLILNEPDLINDPVIIERLKLMIELNIFN